mmetsp:Transcript_20253/g.24554  ORF Transcript_20253/g.24554 Transcript_20253/m.24554 type:complete len:96 (+) Transcript_20253:2452-2739(+)
MPISHQFRHNDDQCEDIHNEYCYAHHHNFDTIRPFNAFSGGCEYKDNKGYNERLKTNTESIQMKENPAVLSKKYKSSSSNTFWGPLKRFKYCCEM